MKIAEQTKEILKKFSWYEILLILASIISVVVLSVIAKSSALTIICSTFGILYVGCLIVQLKTSSVLGVVYTALYIAQSALYQNWGETITQGVVVLPILILTVINWFRHSEKGLTINAKEIGKKEWLILLSVGLVVGVGYYFLLGAFNTPYLILASFSGAFSVVANYLMMRKNIFMFLFFALANVFILLIWLMPVIEGRGTSFETLPMLVVFSFFLISNLLGFINWHKAAKALKKETVKEKEFEGK